jgi:beta-lactamase superfamily II metal-dependent hydrolase
MTGARRRRRAPGRALVLAGGAAALIGLCVGSFAWHAVRVTGAVVMGRAAPAGWPPAGWRAVQCDVGQGDALVVRSGVDRAVLIDAGPDAALVDACLSRLGVRHLDLVVITHFHSDHAAGLAGALHRRSASDVLVSPLGRPAAAAREVRGEALRARAPLVRAWAGLHGMTAARSGRSAGRCSGRRFLPRWWARRARRTCPPPSWRTASPWTGPPPTTPAW